MKGKNIFYINTCFNILKHHSSEECICPYISLRLLVCWLTWLVTEQHTYEWSKKNICPPLCCLPLVTPLIFPHILYSLAITITFTYFWTLWLPLAHLFSPFTPLLHIVQPLGYHSYIPFPLLHPFYIFLSPLATTLTSLFSYITPLWHIVEPFGYHSYIPFPLLHHKQLNAIFLPWKSWALWVCEISISFFQLFFGPGNNI